MRGQGTSGTASALALALLALLAHSGIAGAAAPASRSQATTFDLTRVPAGFGPLAEGPDGSIWFTETYEIAFLPGGDPRQLAQIARIDAQGVRGVVAEQQSAEGFARATDGSVWFTDRRQVGRVGAGGEVTLYPLPGSEAGPSISLAQGPMTAGPDGNLWFSASRSQVPSEGPAVPTATIDRITQAGVITEFDLPGRGGEPTDLTAGPDGNVWFTERTENRIGRISPAGEIATFPLPGSSHPGVISAGPDGNLWYSAGAVGRPMIGRITPSGISTEFPLAAERPFTGAIAAGPDGRVWFAYEFGAIGRIDPDGRLSRVRLPDGTAVRGLLTAADGSVWFSAGLETRCAKAAGCQGGESDAGLLGRVVPAPLSIGIRRTGFSRGDGRVKVRLGCVDGTATEVCHGRIRLRAGGEVIARGRYRLATDRVHGFTLQLGGEARDRLERHGHLRVLCTATSAGADAATRAIVLRTGRAPSPR